MRNSWTSSLRGEFFCVDTDGPDLETMLPELRLADTPDNSGVRVLSADPSSNLKAGDVITRCGDRSVGNTRELRAKLECVPATELGVIRGDAPCPIYFRVVVYGK